MNSIKKYFFVFVVISLAFPLWASAQRVRIQNLPKYDLKPYHFGFALAANKMDFSIKPVDNFNSLDSVMVIESQPQWGFNIGIISNLRLGQSMDLRFIPTLSFGDRILNYSLVENDTFRITRPKKIESTFIDFPLILKYKSQRMNNARAYVLTGFRYSIDLASQAKKIDRKKDLVKLKQNDMLFEFGVGFDFYLTNFKFATEIKMAYGIRDLLERDNSVYTKSIKRLNSKIFQISFLFE